MHLDPRMFVVNPTRIANVVHYLTHGRLIPSSYFESRSL